MSDTPRAAAESGRLSRLATAVVVALALAGCGVSLEHDGPPDEPIDVSTVPDAVPRAEPPSRYGNPPSYVVHGRRYHTRKTSRGYAERGIASWYGRKFHGRRTSSGETYDMNAMTAAHRTLPLPTYVSVENLENGRMVTVRVNDRGPFHHDRIIDLSYAAARKLGIAGKGTGPVEVRAIDPSRPSPPSPGGPDGDRVPVQLYVQVGAFALRANADRLLSRLEPVAGPLADISETVVDGRRLFRVRVGPLVDVAHADRLSRVLQEIGHASTRIVLD